MDSHIQGLQMGSLGSSAIFQEGLDQLSAGKPEEALVQFRFHLRQAHKSGDSKNVAWSLYYMALAHRDLRQHQEEIGLLDEARIYFVQLKNRYGEALVWRELALANKELDRNAIAIDYIQKSISVLEALGQQDDLAYAYDGLSQIYSNLYQRPESLAYAKKARPIFLEEGKEIGAAWNAANLGHLYLDMGYLTEAQQYFEEAKKLFSERRFEAGAAWAQLGEGLVLRAQCQFDLALQAFDRAAQKFQMLGLKDRMAWCLLNQAASHRVLGEAEEAVLMNKKALQIFSPQRNLDGMGWSYFQLGQLMHDQGQLLKAWQTVKEALALHTDIENKKGIGWCENELGKICLDMNDLPRATESFAKAKVLAEEISDARLNVEIDKNLSRVYIEEGKLQRSITMLEEAEVNAQKISAWEIKTEVEFLKVRVNMLIGNREAAKTAFRFAQASLDSAALKRLTPMRNLIRGELLMAELKTTEAMDAFKEALIDANRYHQKLDRTEALFGIALIMIGQKMNGQAGRVLGQVEKDTKGMNSKKVRAKILFLRALIEDSSQKTSDRATFAEVRQLLSMSDLWILRVQFLQYVSQMCRQKQLDKDLALYQKELNSVYEKGCADLRLIDPRRDWADLLPISVIS